MGRVLTLLYHRVREYEEDIQLLAVTPDNFRKQMQYIKNNYHVIRFDDDWSKVGDDSVCITFDDGYRDNFLNAVPILNELNIPATIFVSTGNIDTTREFWWDELERNLLTNKDYSSELIINHPFWGCTWNTGSYDRRRDIYNSLHPIMKNYLSVEERDDWIRQLQEWNKWSENGRDENISLQIRDLKNLNLNGITIGSHTVNHPSLSTLSYEHQYMEIKNAKIELEKIFGTSIDTFSYPFGGSNDYNKNTIDICKKLGIKKVAANISGIYDTDKHLSEYEVPRCIVRDWDIEIFRNNIKMFWREEG